VSAKERAFAEQEAKLMANLCHPNVVTYKDSFSHDGFLYICMGYCEAGDLHTKLRAQRGTLLSETQVVEWTIQISFGLQYLHQHNILHRDLKTQNIFLTRSQMIKLGDLGIARVLDDCDDMANTVIGTPYYMSPELYSNVPYNHKSDIWALGCCVYEMATLRQAFKARDINSLAYKVIRGKVARIPGGYSDELNDVVMNMLALEPDERPSISKIIKTDFVRLHMERMLVESSQKKPKKSRSKEKSASSEKGASVSSMSSVSSITSVSSAIPAAATRAGSSVFEDDASAPYSSTTPTPPQSALRPTPAPRMSSSDSSSSTLREEGETTATIPSSNPSASSTLSIDSHVPRPGKEPATPAPMAMSKPTPLQSIVEGQNRCLEPSTPASASAASTPGSSTSATRTDPNHRARRQHRTSVASNTGITRRPSAPLLVPTLFASPLISGSVSPSSVRRSGSMGSANLNITSTPEEVELSSEDEDEDADAAATAGGTVCTDAVNLPPSSGCSKTHDLSGGGGSSGGEVDESNDDFGQYLGHLETTLRGDIPVGDDWGGGGDDVVTKSPEKEALAYGVLSPAGTAKTPTAGSPPQQLLQHLSPPTYANDGDDSSLLTRVGLIG
jgi:serine/threonine protein kinase